MDFMEKILENSENLLPENTTWNDINKYNQYNHFNFIVTPVLLAVLIYLMRICFERFIAMPIGIYLNIKDNPAFKPNPILETYYSDKTILSESVILFLSKETGHDYEEIKNWFDARRSLNKPSQLKKFNECSWRFLFYLLAWVYGITILYQKPWFWDTRKFWENYPKQVVTDDIYWYYIIELSFYLSLLVTQFFDVKRKDFWQMFLHHVVTIALVSFSYVCNFIRVGSVILVLHDSADYWLEFAKMMTYAKYKKVCDITFVIFAFIWLITRIILFPYKILYSTSIETLEILGPFRANIIFNILLYSLQVMHIIWFYMILRVAYKALIKGNIEKDDRSESEESNHENKRE